ncbi:YceI family protein [Paraburkholderia hospita]|uniref:YceI family protein n=1 Tax=Paraburkholderia hospita TaxID=169430 RepID=UPI0038992330
MPGLCKSHNAIWTSESYRISFADCSRPTVYPSFEVDHFDGASAWRGKFPKSAGKVVLDREARTGSLKVTTETSSVDIGDKTLDKEIVAGGTLRCRLQ